MVRGNHGEEGESDGGRERDEAERPRRDAASDGQGTPVCRLVVRGAALGALAYVVGYVLVFAIALVERSGAGGSVWTVVGWLFYNAHFVGIEVPITGESVNVLVAAGSDGDSMTVPPLVYHLVPPVLLALAGYGAARLEPSSNRGVTATAGAAVVAGYLPLVAAGAFMFAFELPQVGMTLQPDLTASILLAGIAYPVTFGTAAGFVSGGSDRPVNRRGPQGETDSGPDDRHPCGNCGEQVAGADRFCRNCGTGLDD